MLFNSFQFLVFFPLVTGLYFALAQRWRWMLLLAASCAFYMAFIPKYILILGGTIVVDYVAGIFIEKARNPARKMFLVVSILSNVGVLFFFKYFNFLDADLHPLADFLGWNYNVSTLAVILPIGLSFHTFQAMSYTIEVYRGAQKAERHFGIYALYVMFYPQLVAGPIERPQNLIHQFRDTHFFDEGRVVDGLRMMLWGMFKKVVIADRLAMSVDALYDHPAGFEGLSFLVATLFFTFQIYFDFSGYSDIAIGAARVMGFDLMRNFNRPYAARSVAEFWRRWHISLSTWFRDYLYKPLGGSRVSTWRNCFNLIVVFLVSGLWHGANWTYVVWGGLHGILLIASRLTVNFRARMNALIHLDRAPVLHAFLQTALTFGLVACSWVLFRSATLSHALLIFKGLFRETGHTFAGLLIHGTDRPSLGLARLMVHGRADFLITNFLLAGTLLVEAMQLRWSRFLSAAQQPAWLRYASYELAVLAILLFGNFHAQQFIYFQF